MAKELTYRINVAEFERETRRLGPAVIGVYIRILLDYFSQGEAPPDDNTVLARIAGVDLEFWKDLRPKLEPLFQIGGPVNVGATAIWYHAHTQSEVDAYLKRSERAKAAQRGGAEPEPQARNVAAARKSLDEATILGTLELAAVKTTVLNEPGIGAEDDSAEFDDDEDGDEEPPVARPIGIVFEGPIHKDFTPTAKEIAEYMGDGYSSQQIADVLDEFKRYNLRTGTTSVNWPEMWSRWWNRKKPPLHPSEKKAAKPRVEVSRRAPPPSE